MTVVFLVKGKGESEYFVNEETNNVLYVYRIDWNIAWGGVFLPGL